MNKLKQRILHLTLGLSLGVAAPFAVVVGAVSANTAVTDSNSSAVSTANSVTELVADNAAAVSETGVSGDTATSDATSTSSATGTSAAVDSASTSSESNQSASSSSSSASSSSATSSSTLLPRSALAKDSVTTTVSGENGTVAWSIDSAGVLHLSGGGFAWLSSNATSSFSPWADASAPDTAGGNYASLITSVSIEGKISINKTIDATKNYAGLFAGLNKVTSITGLENLDMTGVTDATRMFFGCSALTSLDLNSWNTSSLQTAMSMFQGDSKLTSLQLDQWDTSSLTGLGSMFYGCSSLTSLNLGWADVSKLTNLYQTFYGCSKLTALDLSTWHPQKLTAFNTTFLNCRALTAITFSDDWDTSQVTSMASLFQGCSSLISLKLNNWNTAQVQSMANIFSGCTNLSVLEISDWDTSSNLTLSNAFYNDTNLTELDLSKWSVGKTTTLSSTFSGMKALTTLNLDGWDTSKVTTYTGLFNGDTKLQFLTLGTNFSFHNSTSMALPTPPTTAPYSGKWQKGTTSGGTTYTADDLMTTYDGSTMAGEYTWAKLGTVTVKYVDSEGNSIAADTTLTGENGSDYTTTAPDIAGYTLASTPDNATGKFSTDGDGVIVVTYTYSGNLFFASLPTTTGFGTHELTGSGETYSATADTALSIQDNRPLQSQWQLTAQLDTDGLTSASGKTLEGQVAYLNNGTAKIIGSNASTVVVDHTTTSHDPVDVSGSWTQTDGLVLQVHSSALPDNYSGTITWTLDNTP